MNNPKREVLVVTLHEGRGLSLSPVLQNEESKADEFLPQGTNHQLLPYAILAFDGSSGFVRAVSGTIEDPKWGDEKMRIAYEPDGLESTDLTVRLCIRDPGGPQDSRDICLGFVTTNPFLGQRSQTRSEWLQIQDGTGQIRLDIRYTGNVMAQKDQLFPTNIWKIGQSFEYNHPTKRQPSQPLEGHFQHSEIKKRDLSPRFDVVRPLLSQATSPFIASLKFVSENRKRTFLFSPYYQGGHLFYYLQRARCFDIARSRFYAAEILCALECLHNFDPSYQRLKPKHILLDAVGHIAICDFCLFGMVEDDTERLARPALECSAPETLSGEGSTDAVKWWTLGVFLYEMLTGLPPFYHEDSEEVHRKILSEPLHLPDSLPLSAQDILAKLLMRQPEDRLGAKGASEIQVHPFFDGIVWGKVARREYEPAFKPPEFSRYFQAPVCWVQRPPPTLAEMFRGFSYNRPIKLGSESFSPSVAAKDPPPVKIKASLLDAVSSPPPVAIQTTPPPEGHQTAIEEATNWELVWEQADREFHFYNYVIKAKQSIPVDYPDVWKRFGRDKSQVGSSTSAVDDLPSEAQKHAVLMAMLRNKYRHLVPQFLREYSPTLNPPPPTGKSPLQHVTEQEDVDLVKLFLDIGADANLDISDVSSRWPLRTAVAKGNHELVKILVSRTERAPCTRALSLAVRRGDTAIVEIMLANGVQCDFKESDRPKPFVSGDSFGGCTFTAEPNESDECVPPLVAAVISRKIELAQLLLAHGADANVGYHGVGLVSFDDLNTQITVQCGRAIQLAMDLACHDMVQLLLDTGADINLAQPDWIHQCDMIPRTSYHKITAGLRAAVATRELLKEQ
ncbi:hypothetical protein EDB81DRAFT_233421 [Dactylonectria macrodidyma]|uniref:Uncharacterized protein n=1 Tax=Dactylonectria macrodidyma TaxID=307937 RepID=A0A9P9DKB1_9HYPO|nr:hypothetical protein EDB81DRAFT_233421 [Dactylonectria macrodidyma]